MLLVHGLLHLVGFDHEQGQQQLLDMAQQEAALMEQLGWEGSGLITLAEQDTDSSSSTCGQPSSSSRSSLDSSSSDDRSSDAGSSVASVASVASGSSSSSRWVAGWAAAADLACSDAAGTLLCKLWCWRAPGSMCQHVQFVIWAMLPAAPLAVVMSLAQLQADLLPRPVPLACVCIGAGLPVCRWLP